MNKLTIILTLWCLLARAATADVWADLAAYRFGVAPDTAAEAFELLSNTTPDRFAPIEEKLVQVLLNGNATPDGKMYACRILQQIGTEKCVPALSGLLGREDLSDYARLALERMQGSAKAGEALRNALSGAPDKLKPGIIGSIGTLRDPAAVEPLAKLAAGDNPAVAAAAMLALGKIGNEEAANRLGNLNNQGALHDACLNAQIVCAQRLGGTQATSLYKKILAGNSTPHRVAAMVGLANLDPDTGTATVLAALRSDEERMRQGALTAVAEVKGEGLTKALLPLVDELKGAKQAALMRALGLRGDTAALAGISKYVASTEAVVRDAAIIAAGRLGDGATATMLLGLVGADEAGGAVRTALARMPGADVNGALIAALGSPQLKMAAIPALAARGCTAGVPRLLDLVRDKDADARNEAWPALAVLADHKAMMAIMQAAIATTDANELAAALETIQKVYARQNDKAACFKTIAGFYPKAPDATKDAILALAPLAGDGNALNLARTALNSGNKEQRAAALRALAAWSNKSAEGELLKLAQSAPEEVDRIMALQGYIRIAGMETAGAPDKRQLAMLKTAMDLAKRPAEKKLIAGMLQKVESFDALDVLSASLNDPDVAAEAELASARLLWPLRIIDPDRTWAAACAFAGSRNRAALELANKTLCDIGESRREWQMSDVYTHANGKELFDRAFPPEQGGANVKWSPWLRDAGMSLGATDGSRCVYVKTMLHADGKQTANLEMRTDAAVKVWLNGNLLHEKYLEPTARPRSAGIKLEPERDLPAAAVATRTEAMKLELAQGESTLLVKLVSVTAQPVFACAMRKPGGSPVRGPEKPAPGPRDVDPYIGVYEGVYEHGGKSLPAEARVTTLGPNAPYRATVFVEPESLQGSRFAVSSADMFDALDVYTSEDGKTKGVNYAYYNGNDFKLDFVGRQPAKTGTLAYFSLEPKEAEKSFAFKFTGFVKIPSAGRHRFFLNADDASRLSIDGKVIVENRAWEKSGVAELQAGLHPIEVCYYQHIGLCGLKIGFLKIAEEEEKRIVLKGEGLDTVWHGQLLPEKLVLTPQDPAMGRFVLEYKNRQSPTLGLAPPAGATVLLAKADDGPPSLREWTNKTWPPLPDGSMRVGNRDTSTLKEFGDHQMHLEFLCPFEPENQGQGRGNSGVYVQGRYELQVLDSFGFDPGRNTCGALYYIAPALRPATLPPLTWQTYDVTFHAARFNAVGELDKNPVLELVKLNGRVVHQNLELTQTSYAGLGKTHQKVGPLMLQDHKNQVRYRNIWIKPLGERGNNQ